MKRKINRAKGLAGLLLLCAPVLHAQWQDGLWTGKQANNWFWSFNQGLTFESGSPQYVSGGQTSVMEGTAVMSSSEGELLFYASNGTVWNKNHQQMDNGNGILAGSQSSTQSGIIVPKPGNPDIYYLFNVDIHDGLVYSEIDMSLNGGLGAVTANKNITLQGSANVEKITAVYHADKEQIWVISHRAANNMFLVYRVSEAGIDAPVISYAGYSYSTAPPLEGPYIQDGPAGQLKASPDGTKLAAAQREGELVGASFVNGLVEVFDFDNTTGTVSNPIPITLANSAYGVEFSPNSRYLYVLDNQYNPWAGQLGTTFEKMYQYDLQAANIAASGVMIGQYNSRYMSALQLGPDGKVYMMNSASLNTMVAVAYPNNAGTAAGLQTGVLTVTDGDSIGLPTFNQTYFQSGILHQESCGNNVAFELLRIPDVTAVAWNFGDPGSGADNDSATGQHTFSAPGTYTVTATITSNGAAQTASTLVQVTAGVALTQPQNLEQCVPAGANLAVFDLTMQEAVILTGLNAEDYTVAYYPSELDAQLGTNPFANPENFTSGGEVIYVGVTNTVTGCTGTTAFGLVLTPAAALPVLPNIVLCGNNGAAQFNLTEQELLLNNDNFPVWYFTSEADAVANTSFIPFPGAFINTQNPQTIYVRTGEGGCYSIGTFQVIVTDAPTPDITHLLESCPPFNLAQAVAPGQDSLEFSYYTSEEDATLAQNAIANTAAYAFTGVQAVIYIRTENSQGCYVVEPVGLSVKDCGIPKGISPNGDEWNNDFNLAFLDVSRLVIYNRYGLEVYSLDNYTAEWHGQDSAGHELPAGVYYYMVQPAGGNAKTGWVYLNR